MEDGEIEPQKTQKRQKGRTIKKRQIKSLIRAHLTKCLKSVSAIASIVSICGFSWILCVILIGTEMMESPLRRTTDGHK